MANAETTGSKKGKSLDQDQMGNAEIKEEFDPYEYGMEDGYGLWGAAVHIFRYTFGPGILLLPYNMKRIGYVNAILLQILVNVFCCHIFHISISLEYRLCKLSQVKQIPYSRLAEKIFENSLFPLNIFGAFVRTVLLVYFCLLVYPSTYLLIFSSSVQHLAEYFGCHLDTTYIITVTMVPILIFCMFKRLLKILVPFSATTNILSMIITVVLVTCCIIYRDPTATAQPFGDLNLIPQTGATYIFNICFTLSIIPIKNYMKQPQLMGSRCGAVNITAFSLTFIYLNFALISYFCFGDGVEEDILSNLPKKSILSVIIFMLYAIVLFVMFVLDFSVTFHNIWSDIEGIVSQSKFKIPIEFGIRVGLIAGAYFLAVGLPNFSLLGTICGTLCCIFELALVPVLDMALVFQSEKKCWWTISKDLVILIICASLCYMTIVDCINEAQKLYVE